VDVIVPKPFSRAQLAEAISRALAVHAEGAEAPEDYSAAA